MVRGWEGKLVSRMRIRLWKEKKANLMRGSRVILG
jgi:hypothetical protein